MNYIFAEIKHIVKPLSSPPLNSSNLRNTRKEVKEEKREVEKYEGKVVLKIKKLNEEERESLKILKPCDVDPSHWYLYNFLPYIHLNVIIIMIIMVRKKEEKYLKILRENPFMDIFKYQQVVGICYRAFFLSLLPYSTR